MEGLPVPGYDQPWLSTFMIASNSPISIVQKATALAQSHHNSPQQNKSTLQLRKSEEYHEYFMENHRAQKHPEDSEKCLPVLWVELCSPLNIYVEIQPPVPQDMTLSENRVIADIIS